MARGEHHARFREDVVAANALWDEPEYDEPALTLREAMLSHDWDRVFEMLRSATVSRNTYGRQALFLRRSMPFGVHPQFTQLRGLAAIPFGDWDDVQRALDAGPADPIAIARNRDVVVASIGATTDLSDLPAYLTPTVAQREYLIADEPRKLRRLAREMSRWRPEMLDAPVIVSAARHLRFRRLVDTMLLARQEAIAGNIVAAAMLAHDATELGDEGDAHREIAHDLDVLCTDATARAPRQKLRYLKRIASSTGPSPLAAALWLLALFPLWNERADLPLEAATNLVTAIGERVASPRLSLQGHAWRVLAAAVVGDRMYLRNLRSLMALSRRATGSVRAVARLASALAHEEPEEFARAERDARHAGNVALQVTALTWLAALDASRWPAQRLPALLRVTGWRRPALVPEAVVARAALGLCDSGARGHELLELGDIACDAETQVRVAEAHLRSPVAALRAHAIRTLGRSPSPAARTRLMALSEDPQLGALALRELLPPHPRLSDREQQVLLLAGRGLTNKEIAVALSLSAHTVEAHVERARSKLGAANRAEAVAKVDAGAVFPRTL